ncbi:MAG: winged helix-turn-helix domain-containing protein [Bacteroidota bacterium]|nr:winged helix-turn-helix domain-containing protein [Bacteroidota bacterium]
MDNDENKNLGYDTIRKCLDGGQIGGQIGGQMPKTRIEILNQIMNNPSITRKELKSVVGIAESAIQKHIKILIKDGYIKREGKTQGSYFLISKDIKNRLSNN